MVDFLEDAWDAIVDGFTYLISFEWFGDVWEVTTDFFGSMFENLGEFSFLGLTFGMLAAGFSYSTRFINIDGSGLGTIEVMTQSMPPAQRVFWIIASYAGAFLAGYLLGKRFENT